MSAFAWRPRGPLARLFCTVLGVCACPGSAAAAWSLNRDLPSATEIAAVDATGETGWPYGAEDIAGDGLSVFSRAEQARDIRTVYTATDNTRFWVRLYASDATATATDLVAFVFVDSDRNTRTGGNATGAELDPALPADPTGGGYDAVVALDGDGTMIRLWAWDQTARVFAPQNLNAADSAGESGRAIDPILLGAAEHGYVQASLRSDLLGIAQACAANVFVRTVNPTGAAGGQDVNVDGRVACVPPDRNADRVPDVVVVPGCTSDVDCPLSGICVARRCVIPPPCNSDANCAADAQCSPNGWCVARPAGTCTTAATCGDLVCNAGRCSACSAAANDCATGYRCAPTGRCIPESGPGSLPPTLNADEKVEGGAFHCGLSPSRHDSSLLVLFLTVALGLLRRARPSQRPRA